MHLGTSLRKLVRCSSWISFAANKFSLKKGRKKVGGDISSSNHQIVDPPTPGTQRRSPFETFRLNDSTCQTIQDNARQYNKGNTGIIYDADQSQIFFSLQTVSKTGSEAFLGTEKFQNQDLTLCFLFLGGAGHTQGNSLVNGVWRAQYIFLCKTTACTTLKRNWAGLCTRHGNPAWPLPGQHSASLWPYFSLWSTCALRSLQAHSQKDLKQICSVLKWIFHAIFIISMGREMEAWTVSSCSSLRYHVFRRWHSSLAFSHSPTPQCQNSQDCYQSITAADATHVAYAIQCNSVQHIQLMQMTLKLSKTQATYQSLPMCPRNLHFQRCAGVEAGGRRGGGRQNHHHGH